ncbi:MAG TPA: helix-turn-helix domain-containing protein [Anaeromyxobacteraceae bacterium]|nr:helix-turn-helix domain-containing protein [Anaeromyxobacteraceae bacterium]
MTEVLREAGMVPVRHGQPLPLRPAGSVALNGAVALLETDEGGVVFVWGMASWCWTPGDVVGRRLAAVQVVETGAATAGEVAEAFGVNADTLRRWRRSWESEGVEGLAPRRRGPKGPTKLTGDKRAEIRRLRAEGMGLRAIGREVGLDPDTVRRALGAGPPVSSVPSEPAGPLEPLARPEPRVAERQLARVGVLTGAEPQICEGACLPLAGALLVLPALAATGLLDAFAAVYATGRAAFYSLRSLVLTVVFCVLVGEPRAEGLCRLDPVDVGRLLGLDRAPEVKTLRRRVEELAAAGRSVELLRRLAETHLATAGQACGLFYVDGHVRAYHGAARLPKAHLARARLAAPAEVDTWVCDARGEGVLVWNAEPGASLAGELHTATAEIRALVGPDASPTVAFDRGGYSPKLFAELAQAGFHILTYRKAPVRREPRTAFRRHQLTDDLGRRQVYLLAERRVRLAYTEGRRKRYFECRQVTRADPESGHQTQVLTTRRDLGAAQVAYAMFSRWRQENFFRYMRHNLGLDALDSYAKVPDDPSRSVPNPAKRAAAANVTEARTAIAAAHEAEGRAALAGRRPNPNQEIAAAFAAANDELARRVEAAKAVPARVPLGELHPDAQRLAPERKRIHDAIRMAVYNAESALTRLLAPHYRRADDEARTLLKEAFHSPADLEVKGDELHVRINPLSAPRRSRAIAGLCQALNATETLYPGTKLRLTYSVKNP